MPSGSQPDPVMIAGTIDSQNSATGHHDHLERDDPEHHADVGDTNHRARLRAAIHSNRPLQRWVAGLRGQRSAHVLTGALYLSL